MFLYSYAIPLILGLIFNYLNTREELKNREDPHFFSGIFLSLCPVVNIPFTFFIIFIFFTYSNFTKLDINNKLVRKILLLEVKKLTLNDSYKKYANQWSKPLNTPTQIKHATLTEFIPTNPTKQIDSLTIKKCWEKPEPSIIMKDTLTTSSVPKKPVSIKLVDLMKLKETNKSAINRLIIINNAIGSILTCYTNNINLTYKHLTVSEREFLINKLEQEGFIVQPSEFPFCINVSGW